MTDYHVTQRDIQRARTRLGHLMATLRKLSPNVVGRCDKDLDRLNEAIDKLAAKPFPEWATHFAWETVVYQFEYELMEKRRCGTILIVNPPDEVDIEQLKNGVVHREIEAAHPGHAYRIRDEKYLSSERGVFHDWGFC